MSTYTYVHPRLRALETLGAIAWEAAQAGSKEVRRWVRPKRSKAYATRRPGIGTPLWNECVRELRQELRMHGSKARLARYLGFPRQRLNDFLTGRSRLPDAEITLRLLAWLACKRKGRDLSL